MSNSLKQVRRMMLVIFAATTGVVACDSATAPDQSVAVELRAVDRQVNEAELMEDIDIGFRSKDSGSQAEAE